MRLIDADALFEYIQKEKAWKQDVTKQPRYGKGKYDAYYEMLEIIKDAPTVDPTLKESGCELCRSCDICANSGFEKCYTDCDFEGKKHFKPKHNYCPNCGAKMEGNKP